MDGGTAHAHLTYTTFGQIITTAPTPRFTYTGREWDADAQLFYYRARWYDAATGRFLGQDPVGFRAGDGNLYRYVGNGPTNAVDPTGLEEVTQVRPSAPVVQPQSGTMSPITTTTPQATGSRSAVMPGSAGMFALPGASKEAIADEVDAHPNLYRPFTNKVPGHVPDTAITGKAKPPMWLPMTRDANSKLGGSLGPRIDWPIDGIVLTRNGKVVSIVE